MASMGLFYRLLLKVSKFPLTSVCIPPEKQNKLNKNLLMYCYILPSLLNSWPKLHIFLELSSSKGKKN